MHWAQVRSSTGTREAGAAQALEAGMGRAASMSPVFPLRGWGTAPQSGETCHAYLLLLLLLLLLTLQLLA